MSKDSGPFNPCTSHRGADPLAHNRRTAAIVRGILIVDYDPLWPELFRREADRILGALARRALLIEHTGSTSVPGLPAKPIIDIFLMVTDSADENTYAPNLERAGYVLRIREPNWHENRMFKGPWQMNP